MKKELLIELLEDLLKMEDILACILVRKGLDGIIPSNTKLKDPKIWITLKQTSDQMFYFIDKFFDYGIERVYFELENYKIIFTPITRNFSLIVLVPSLANMGLIGIEIENTKMKIKKAERQS